MTKNYINPLNIYTPPNFTPEQQKLLLKYFSNLDKPVYAFTSNVPTEVAGALISRFSRSNTSPRELFLEEFLKNPDLGLEEISLNLRGTENNAASEAESAARERAGKFFRQVLAKYGDESVAEMTGVYVVVEKASTIAIKVIESMRRMAFIEQSTRYIDLTQKVEGKYEYYRDSKLSETLGVEYENLIDEHYSKYREWFENIRTYVKAQNPQLPEDTEVGYNQAVHSRTCDILRELLPLGLRATVGIFGFGRDWSDLINIMIAHELEEVRELGKMLLSEVSQIIPNIMERTSGPHGQSNQEYIMQKNVTVKNAIRSSTFALSENSHLLHENIIRARILNITEDPITTIAAGIAYSQSNQKLNVLKEYYKINLSKAKELLKDVNEIRKNRFDKVVEGFETVRLTVEFTAPWSCWKDIQRHRRLTEIHNSYFVDTNFYTAPELEMMGLDKEYKDLMFKTLTYIDKVQQIHPHLSKNVEYLVPHGANFRWIMEMDFAEAIYMMELRSIASGHMTYRTLMHEFYKSLEFMIPELCYFVKFIDMDQYYLGRRTSYNKVVQKGASLE